MTAVSKILDELTDEPKHVADCCLSLSRPLIEFLLRLLPPAPSLTLSIGCGTGLLEHVLLEASSGAINLRGVEVRSNVNKYLPESHIDLVSGTWAMYPDASAAAAWMFVYPREPRLVRMYLDAHVSSSLQTIIWLGPRNDWPDYVGLFKDDSRYDMEELTECGLVAYELMAVCKRVSTR